MLLISRGFNKRLGTNNLTLVDTFMEAQKRGLKIMDVAVMPEQDSWIFHNGPGFKDGPSMVCDVLVMRVFLEFRPS